MTEKTSNNDSFYHELVSHMLTFDFPGSKELNDQMKDIDIASNKDGDGYDIVEMFVKSGPLAEVESRTPIELEALDEDGIPISAILFVDEGRLHLIDIYKVDGSEVRMMPPVSAFRRTQWEVMEDGTRVRKSADA